MGGNPTPGPYGQEYLQKLVDQQQLYTNPYTLNSLQAKKPADIYILGQRFDGQTGEKK